jgi:tetratricopeptide (TPR) repeat protein
MCIRLGRFEEAQAAFHTSITLYQELDRRPLPGWGTEPLIGAALLASTMGDYAEAVRLGGEGLKRIDASDKLNLVFALYVLATAIYSQGQFESAFSYARRAYQMSDELSDHWFGAYILVVMGNIAAAIEDYDQAWEYYQASYTLKSASEKGGMWCKMGAWTEKPTQPI